MKRRKKKIYPWRAIKNIKFPTKVPGQTVSQFIFFQEIDHFKAVYMNPENCERACQVFVGIQPLIWPSVFSSVSQGSRSRAFASRVLVISATGSTNARLGRGMEKPNSASRQWWQVHGCCERQWWKSTGSDGHRKCTLVPFWSCSCFL